MTHFHTSAACYIDYVGSELPPTFRPRSFVYFARTINKDAINARLLIAHAYACLSDVEISPGREQT